MPSRQCNCSGLQVEKYLDRCLGSICGQTYTRLEIICVDDGSPDNSIDILSAYAARDERVRIIRQENGGLSAARNSALDIARGEWITFVDSDDWLEKDTFETCVSKISDRIDAVIYGVCVDNEMGEEDPDQAGKEEYHRVKFEGEREFTDEVILATDVVVWNKFFRASVINDNGLRFPVGRFLCEDISFTYRFFLLSRCGYYISQKLMYHYIQRKGSIMHTTRQKTPRAIEHLYALLDIHKVIAIHKLKNQRIHLMAHLADSYIRLAIFYSPDECREEVIRQGSEITKKLGVSDFTEFDYIRLVSCTVTNPLLRLFYRKGESKIQYGLFGLMLLSIQRKKGFIDYRFFGIKIYRRKDSI
ncbi:MAG: glycosyltransferase family 2 protein [Akkermansia muciniphila]